MKYLILYDIHHIVSIYYENGRKNVSGVSREREMVSILSRNRD